MHPNQESLKEMILEAGFDKCKFYNLVNGIVCIHVAYEK
jgi:demethylmenaquinone methyltransferase/2-methoxy-6-polyprenyl-1,4-benzoquinol methylase